MASGNADVGRRIRSFLGCTTCRGRRLKCDEQKPACLKCRHAGLTCGYENSLIFDSGKDADGPRYRRPLLTIKERESMSKQITDSVPPRLALWHITQIDEQCENLSPVGEVLRGPFGAFKLARQDNGSSADAGTTIEDSATETPPQVAESGFSDHTEIAWWPEFPEALEFLNDTADNMGFWTTGTGFEQLRNVSEEFPYPIMTDPPAQSHVGGGRRSDEALPNDMVNCLAISRSISPVSGSRIDIPQSAWTLLKNYTQSVLKSLTPFHHHKTPWHVLFMPLVKNCLAGLTLQESLDDATLCVFYGTLAISALSLGGTAKSQSWSQKSDTYRWRALEFMKAAKPVRYGGPKKAKYKTQLMALLTMAQFSTLSGNRNDTEYFLVEAEKLIRIYGLNRKKSRKVRLLHHCYAYERIFFESTSARGKHSVQYHHSVRKAIESSGASAYSRDTLSFRLPSSDNLESDMLLVKDAELGENDLHLQNPGLWPSSQYEEIFGLPERYVLFVSLIVRLAREKDGEIDDDQPGTLTMKSFTSRAKAIERCINQSRPLEPRPNTAVDHLVAAVHSAVVIYFYRKIHDVDACMLQKQVSDVLGALQDYDSLNAEKGFGSVRLTWPAFIAACEAEDSATQTFFANWFEIAAQQSGLRLFDATMANVERIWKQKREGLDTRVAYHSYVEEAGLDQRVWFEQMT